MSEGTQVLSCKAINDLKLRSDHRAVQVCIEVPTERGPRRRRKRKKCTNWTQYQNVVGNVERSAKNNLVTLENEFLDVADTCQVPKNENGVRPWDSDKLQQLRTQRRSATCPVEKNFYRSRFGVELVMNYGGIGRLRLKRRSLSSPSWKY